MEPVFSMFCGAAGENCHSADLTLSEPLRPNHVRRPVPVDVALMLALTPTTEHGWSRPAGLGDEGQGAERGQNGKTHQRARATANSVSATP